MEEVRSHVGMLSQSICEQRQGAISALGLEKDRKERK